MTAPCRTTSRADRRGGLRAHRRAGPGGHRGRLRAGPGPLGGPGPARRPALSGVAAADGRRCRRPERPGRRGPTCSAASRRPADPHAPSRRVRPADRPQAADASPREQAAVELAGALRHASWCSRATARWSPTAGGSGAIRPATRAWPPAARATAHRPDHRPGLPGPGALRRRPAGRLPARPGRRPGRRASWARSRSWPAT